MGVDIDSFDKLGDIEDFMMRDHLRPSLMLSMGKPIFNHSMISSLTLSCGGLHSAILKNDGEVLVFGENIHGQCNSAEEGKHNVIQVACG
mmetsp:Transcript_4545/g.4028  ORF Transcript_4545/g.4028 Transcript_4545/m.4028 type:complete len:90 (+) Transcript_4545:1694-1963(+)